MESNRNSLKRTARLAGILGLIMGIPLPFSLFYVPSKIIVSGNANATATNILNKEFLFRAGIVGHIFAATVFLLLVFVLYRLFNSVNGKWAKLMVALVVVQIPIVFLIETLNFSALMLLKGDILKSSNPLQYQYLSMLLVKTGRYGISLLQVFWGLWLLPYGLLVYKSGFIPRVFGVLLFINGIGYLIDTFAFLLFQKNDYLFVRQFTFVTYFGEAAIMLWYLIKGVKNNRPANNNNNERTTFGFEQ
ncbi:MAG TPA: DUF4386 domain-containing protein [Chitinophagaceae bacterium]|nr:DUF4386 domain-containing protein [Chitinophagaceae bacterium]